MTAPADALGQGSRLGRNATAIAKTTEILRGIEAERRRIAKTADMGAIDPRAMGLRAILDHKEALRPGNGHDGRDLSRNSVEVNHDDGLGARTDGRGDKLPIHTPRLELDIDEAGFGPKPRDCHCRRRSRQCRDENLVTGAYPQRIECERQRIGPGIDADHVRQADVATELGFKHLGFLAENIAAAGDNASHGLVDLAAPGLELKAGSGLRNA
jgi:hypothetical protein